MNKIEQINELKLEIASLQGSLANRKMSEASRKSINALILDKMMIIGILERLVRRANRQSRTMTRWPS